MQIVILTDVRILKRSGALLLKRSVSGSRIKSGMTILLEKRRSPFQRIPCATALPPAAGRLRSTLMPHWVIGSLAERLRLLYAA